MKNKSLILIFAILLFFLVPTFVFADAAPKSSADIHITLNGQNITNTSFNAIMLSCQKEEDYHPFPDPDLITQLNISEYDPIKDCYWKPKRLSGGDCQDSNCHFYSVSSGFKLAVYLPSQDKVYLSAEVTPENFASAFEANLLSDGSIDIQETTTFFQSNSVRNIIIFLIFLILTLFLELSVTLIYVSILKIPKKVLISVLVANFISLPILWFVFPPLFGFVISSLKMILLPIILGEVLVFVFEGYFIHLLNKEIISLKRSFLLSILINLASLIISGPIFLLLIIF